MTKAPTSRQQFRPSNQDILASLQRILESRTFSHSTTLRKALEFVVRTSIDAPHEPIKEYSVATEALGRGSGFDPKVDNVVRVQMHRLREKLEDFYREEGHGEQFRIIIPRGQYSPEYVKSSSNEPPSAEGLPKSANPPGKPLKSRRVIMLWAAIVVLVVSNAFFAGTLLTSKTVERATTLAPSLKSFWRPFLSSNDEPLIVFANPALLVDKQGNMYRYNSPDILSMAMGTRVSGLTAGNALLGTSHEDGPFYYFDSFTGTGELVAATDITHFLTLHGQHYVIERSLLASDEEIMRKNVIFLGGNKEDRLLGKLPLQQELLFEPPPPNKYAMGSYIRDLDPPPGHPSTYHLQLDPKTGAIVVGYALISLLPNFSANRYVLDVGGLTTLGTQAAAKFATSKYYMTGLEQMLGPSAFRTGRTPYFQALLQISVRDGVPLKGKCILIHKLKRPDMLGFRQPSQGVLLQK